MKAILPLQMCCKRAMARLAANQAGLSASQSARTQALHTTSSSVASANLSRQRQSRRYIATTSCLSQTSVEPSTSTSTSAALPSHHERETGLDNVKVLQSHRIHQEPSQEQVASHLNGLFEGLQPSLPPDLAQRMVTHKGWVSPSASSEASLHNSKLSLIGRRVIRLYISLFLQAHSQQIRSKLSFEITHDVNDSVERLAHTLTLGRYVGTKWELEHKMFWRPAMSSDGRPTGLTKVSGTAVEAIIGGLYRQYGAVVALNAFNSRVLPFLPLPDGARESAIQLAQQSRHL